MILVTALIIVVFVVVFGCVIPPEPTMTQVSACAVDSDCVLVEAKGCCPGEDAINKNYISYWNSLIVDVDCENANCSTIDSPIPACVENKCVVTGTNSSPSNPDCPVGCGVGDSWYDGCNNCSCDEDSISCTERFCDPSEYEEPTGCIPN